MFETGSANVLINIGFIFVCLLSTIQQSWTQRSTGIPKCTELVCKDYIDDFGCPDVSNCTGILLPSPTKCNCCKYCLDYIEEGGICSQGVPGQASVQMICGPQLTCSENNVCVKMTTECMKDKAKFEEKWENGLLGGGEIEPLCDDHGDYGHIQCIPGSICFCSSPLGERIFGEMVNKNADMASRMDCACSRDEWRARTRIKNMKNKLSMRLNMKSLFARCLPSGSYSVLQCVETRCACVDEKGVPQPLEFGKKVEYAHLSSLKNGKPWCFNFTNYEDGSFDTPCLKEREKILKTWNEMQEGRDEGKSSIIALGLEYEIPECDPDGRYSRVQQSWKKKYCVDPDGNLLYSGDVEYSVPLFTKAGNNMDCNCARTVYLLMEWEREEAKKSNDTSNVEDATPFTIVRLPKCCPNGNFARWQCHHDECHCVDENGAQMSTSVNVDRLSTLPCYSDNDGEECDPYSA